MEIKNIFIVLTPFQKSTMLQLFDPLFNERSTLVFHSEHTTFKDYKCETAPLNDFKFSRKKLLNYKFYQESKKAIARIRYEINNLEIRYRLGKKINIYIGSEKDIFTQMFLNTPFIAARLEDLIAVEEGLGYYKYDPSIKIKFIKLAYKYLTPLLFKQKLNFIYTLGVDPRINKVYARLPDMLPIKSNEVTYRSIEKSVSPADKKDTINSRKILIFSFPNQDYGVDEEEKVKIFETLINSLKEKTIVIKPHPREDADFFNKFAHYENIQVLNKDKTGESLDYFEYQKIINFSSSIIIDILTAGYPTKLVYTIFMKENSKLAFFNKTSCIKLSELYNFNFEN